MFFFFNDTSTPDIYTLSLHDALPISLAANGASVKRGDVVANFEAVTLRRTLRSEEHTSELQLPYDLVCRLLLEKKNKSHHINRRSHIHHRHRDQSSRLTAHQDLHLHF